jgi:hypothetical protein
MPLDSAAMHLNHAGEEHGEQSDKQKNETKDVLVGEISHKWQPCSTSDTTIVK